MPRFFICFLCTLAATGFSGASALTIESGSLHTGATTSTSMRFNMAAELKNIPTQTLRVTLPENQPEPIPTVLPSGPIITSPVPGSFVPEAETTAGSGGSSNGTVYRGSNKTPRTANEGESLLESAPNATNGYVPLKALQAVILTDETGKPLPVPISPVLKDVEDKTVPTTDSDGMIQATANETDLTEVKTEIDSEIGPVEPQGEYGSMDAQYRLQKHVRSVLRPRARFQQTKPEPVEILFGVTKIEYEIKPGPFPFPAWIAGLLLGSWVLNLFLLFLLWRGPRTKATS